MMPGDSIGLLFHLPDIWAGISSVLWWVFTDGLPYIAALLAVSWIWGKITDGDQESKRDREAAVFSRQLEGKRRDYIRSRSMAHGERLDEER